MQNIFVYRIQIFGNTIKPGLMIKALQFICFTGIILFSSPALAQKNTGGIEGKVVGADGQPAFVTLQLKQLKRATVSDKNGYFKILQVGALQDTLVITAVGYEPVSLAVSIDDDGITNVGRIEIKPVISQLQDIEIKGTVAHSYKSDYTFLAAKIQSNPLSVPQSVSTITKEMIQDKMEFTLKDAADDAAGVNHYSGYDDYTIRGFKAENARLINGLRGYNTTYTSAMLVNVERIEVVKGPSATLYGNCDPGGTINLVTKKPLAKNEREIEVAVGSWDHFRAQGDVTGPMNKSKTLLYRLNAGVDNTHSFRNGIFAKSYEIAPSFSFIPNKKIQVNVDFSLSHINTVLDRGQPGFRNDFSLKSTPANLSASQPGDYLHETDVASSLLFSYKINKNFHFNSGYLHYITQQNTAEHGIHSYITEDSVNLFYNTWKYHTVTNTITNYFTYNATSGKFNHQLLAGYDFISSDVNLHQNYFEQPDQFGTSSGIAGTFSLKNPAYIQRPISKYKPSGYNADATNVEASIYTTQGIYVQEQLSYNKWKLLVSLRQDMYEGGDGDVADSTGDDELTALLPRVGLVYELSPSASLYATYNKGFDPFEASTSTQVFNAPYKPVISQLYEAGAKANFFNNQLAASVALYQLTLNNVAVNANDIANPNLYIQQGKNRSRGIETEANGNILPNLSLAVSYSYCVVKVVESIIRSQQGTIVENAPKHSSSSWLKYSVNKGLFKGLSIAAGHSQVSSRTTLQQGLNLPGYFVLSGGLRYAFKHFTTAVNVNNITNQTYWIGGYNTVNKWIGTPRNIMLSLGYKF